MPGNPSHALFSRLFRENRDKVFRFAYKLTEDEARADDITQQCFIRLWESIDTVREQEDIFPLLFVLVKRLVIDDTRRLYREKKKMALLREAPEEQAQNNNLQHKELVSYMERLIEKMPEQRRLIYRMSRQDGHSYKEIALRLRLSPATVRNHLSLALQYIRQELAVYFGK